MNLSIGTLYSVKCKYNAPYKTKDNLVTYTGKVVPSAKYDPPSTFRLTTEIADFPFRVIDFKSVVSFNGDTFNYELPKEEVRTVLGSRGDVYTVVTTNGRTTCTCPGFQFKKRCKHTES